METMHCILHNNPEELLLSAEKFSVFSSSKANQSYALLWGAGGSPLKH